MKINEFEKDKNDYDLYEDLTENDYDYNKLMKLKFGYLFRK